MNIRQGNTYEAYPFWTALWVCLIWVVCVPGMGHAQVTIAPGGPPLCSATEGNAGGDTSTFELDQNKARGRAKGTALQEHSSFAEVGVRFTAFASFPATLSVGVGYSGKLRGFGGGNSNRGSVKIEVTIRDVTQNTEMASQVVLDKVQKGKPLTTIVEVVAHNVFDPPIAEFEVDLVQGREYAATLRLEAKAKGINALSDFHDNGRHARFGCFEIIPTLVDTDGDGLYDAWEEQGIDVDGDGIDLNLNALGVDYRGIPIALDPQRKDILVEIDYFNCAVSGGDCSGGDTHTHEPNSAALDVIRQAFADAPVPNPVGPDGINLWVLVDEELPHQQNCDLDDGCFDTIKSAKFGTVAERNDPKTITAKRLAFRYNVWVHDKNPGNGSSGEADGSAGISGDDFVVSLGSWTSQIGTQDDQAGTFMHELGHTLALGHGGGDNANCKPNYLSVMSYTFQVTGKQPTDTFDFSRSPLPNAGQLQEDALNEPIGIQDNGFTTFYGPLADVDGIDQGGDGNVNDDWIPGTGVGPIDWDFDGDNTDNPAAPTDINYLGIRGCNNNNGPPDPAPDQVLTGFNDWGLIKFNFRDSPFFPAGEHGAPPVEELDFETAEVIKDRIWRAQLETVYEYSAKVVCGVQEKPEELRLAVGRYATTVNIHNPNTDPVKVRKKLALTYPPAEQRQGQIIRIGLDKLRYDEAVKVDCDELKRTVFEGEFPTPYIEGFVVVQSPESLDVTGVYTTATTDQRGQKTFHSSIDVEPVKERVIRRGRPDLVPQPALPTPEEAGLPEGFPGVLFCVKSPEGGASSEIRVVVKNQGPVPAGPSVTSVAFANGETASTPTPALGPGEETTLTFAIPPGCYPPGFSTSCTFEITVDAAAQVSESKEGNNSIQGFCTGPAG